MVVYEIKPGRRQVRQLTAGVSLKSSEMLREKSRRITMQVHAGGSNLLAETVVIKREKMRYDLLAGERFCQPCDGTCRAAGVGVDTGDNVAYLWL